MSLAWVSIIGRAVNVNTEYYMTIDGFKERVQVSEESTFTEDLGSGDRVRLKINSQKINVFTSDGTRNLLGGVGE